MFFDFFLLHHKTMTGRRQTHDQNCLTSFLTLNIMAGNPCCLFFYSTADSKLSTCTVSFTDQNQQYFAKFYVAKTGKKKF